MVKPGRAANALQLSSTLSQETEDLSHISQTLHEDQILHNLFLRLSKDAPFTQVGDRLLMMAQPNKPLNLFTDDVSKQYAEHMKSFPIDTPLPPHAYRMAANAYFHMLREGQDQSILLSGDAGSGKTQTHRMITRQLCDLSKSSKKKSRIHSSVLKVDAILSSFGNASTSRNENASFHARYVEYQFDVDGKMVGAKYITFLLDKNRLTDAHKDEFDGRIFKVFYQMMAGASAEEKQQWHLNEKFRYMNTSSKPTEKDAQEFQQLNDHLKSLGIGRRQQAQLFQLLAAILHLGNIDFMNDSTSNEACMIKNRQALDITASLLGIESADLESVLTSRTRLVFKDLISEFLDAESAAEQRDSLARSLYAIATTWIVDQINLKLCKEDSEWSQFIAVLDMPGLVGADESAKCNNLYRLLSNYANTRLLSFIDQQFGTDAAMAAFEREGFGPLSRLFSTSTLAANMMFVSETQKRHASHTGLLALLDQLCHGATVAQGPHPNDVLDAITRDCSSSPAFLSTASDQLTFSIRHHKGCIVEYNVQHLCHSNMDVVQDDFVGMVKGGSAEMAGSINGFFRSLVKADAQGEATAKIGEQVKRRPSMKRRKGEKQSKKSVKATVASLCQSTIHDIFACLADTKPWVIFHIQPTSDYEKFDVELAKCQMNALDIPFYAMAPSVMYAKSMSVEEFFARYGDSMNFGFQNTQPHLVIHAVSDIQELKHLIEKGLLDGYGWYSQRDVKMGNSKVYYSEKVWFHLEECLKEFTGRSATPESGSQPALLDYRDDAMSFVSENESHYSSEYEYEPNRNLAQKKDVESGFARDVVDGPFDKQKSVSAAPVKQKASKSRQRWLCCVWATTWWIPSFFLSCCGKMKRKDQQIAWREKVTLCFIIFLLCAFILFFIIGLSWILCPPQRQLSAGEVGSRNKASSNPPLAYMYGVYYDMGSIIDTHVNRNGYVTTIEKFEATVLGQDISMMFDKSALWDRYCKYEKPNNYLLFGTQQMSTEWFDHYRQATNKNRNYFGLLSAKGTIVWDRASLETAVAAKGANKRMITMFDKVYDISSFYSDSYKDVFFGQNSTNSQFTSRVKAVFDNFGTKPWQDATGSMQSIKNLDATEFQKMMFCMDNLLYVGGVDHRNDLKCVIPNYILLVAAAILVAVIGFKFLAALQLGKKKQPEYSEKFVICQVPCYTEGEVSLSRTLNSLAVSEYDDKRKLIFVICDGMIIGTGNDRPTPRIVLDLLGVDPMLDPEALQFQSLGEGSKQNNYGKVYSGLYEYEGRAVPFIVVVKVGSPTERQRPGNRGKRDSQMVLMRFLSRVHFNQPLCPLELEMYHQIKNVIGVDPSFYEFVLMVDADTEVVKDALNRLVSSMIRDSKIIGICGETQIANEKSSWVTMIQVYEYFISHHLSKAFESLFGSVTCLPGCFCMYRIRTPVKNQPVLVAPAVIEDYSENNVDTLHLKNLLHLGEDRYLSTLMMKHFPQNKLMFTPDAKALTVSPEKWSVIISQRRRWINSTVHNLLELLYLPELCGFCCFSMRFVVFIDLFATVVQPAALLYVIYLVIMAIWNPTETTLGFPLISLIMIACVYGFQVIIFLLKREWQHIGWMLIYMVAIPVFSFWLPLYAFWHFDDFSWGTTRRVVGDDKKTHYVAQIETFDPKTIPLKRWTDHENEINEKQETASFATFNEAGSMHSGRGSMRYRGSDMSSAYGSSVYGSSGGYYSEPISTASAYPSNLYPSPMMPMPMVAPTSPVPPSFIATLPDVSGNRNSFVSFGGHSTNVATSSVGMVSPPPASGMSSPVPSQSSVGVIPSDQELLKEIQTILATADLMTVTKKSVREQLSRTFGVDLGMKKEYIHRCIDSILKGEL